MTGKMESMKPAPRHLTDAELGALAIPAAGVPEALPAHLSDCLACTRALNEWKSALAAVGDEGGPLDARTEEDWGMLAESTMDRIRVAPLRHSSTAVRWTVGVAASLLLAVLSVPIRNAARPDRPAGGRDGGRTELSGQDQADDALLRDVARMARAEDDGGEIWDSLAPEPGPSIRKEGTL